MRSVLNRVLKPYKDTPHGPSGGSRTHGLMDPNHARYQLRYTRMFSLGRLSKSRGHGLRRITPPDAATIIIRNFCGNVKVIL